MRIIVIAMGTAVESLDLGRLDSDRLLEREKNAFAVYTVPGLRCALK
jgi:hypothetical protein